MGAQPSVVPRSRTIRFEDLPPEIRNRIYHLALVEVGIDPIELHSFSFDWFGWTRTTRRYEPEDQVCRPAALLRVSRQVHAEAMPILYGANAFKFADIFIEKLLNEPLSWVAFLRKVTIFNLSTQGDLKEIFVLLRKAVITDRMPVLEKLELTAAEQGDEFLNFTPGTLLAKTAPLLKAIMKAKGVKANAENVSRTIAFNRDPRAPPRSSPPWVKDHSALLIAEIGRYSQFNQEFQEQAKTMLEALPRRKGAGKKKSK